MKQRIPQIAFDGLMITDQLAIVLGVSPRTLKRWQRDGLGPPRLTVGRSVRYRLSDVNAWLAEKVHGAKDAA